MEEVERDGELKVDVGGKKGVVRVIVASEKLQGLLLETSR